MASLAGKQLQTPSHTEEAELHHSLLETARQTCSVVYLLWKNFSEKKGKSKKVMASLKLASCSQLAG